MLAQLGIGRVSDHLEALVELYLMQHGLALPSEVDPERPLSEQGRAEVVRVAVAAAAVGVSVGEIWHSGKLRAAQTAQVLADALAAGGGTPSVSARGGLNPESDVAPIAGWLRGMAAGKRVAIVGHLPFLSRLAGTLLVGPAGVEPIAVRNAGLVRLVRGESGRFQVSWILSPDCLPE